MQIEGELDSRPTEEKILNFVRLSIRNKQCFRELDHLNRKGTLLFKHPLLHNFSLQQELSALLKANPAKFLDDYALAKGNVSRYQSYLNNKSKGSDEQRKGWEGCLADHAEKLRLMELILKESATR